MSKTGKGLLCALLLAPGAAMAAPGFVDIYYVPKTDLDVNIPGFGSGSDSGNGFGIRGLIPTSPTFALTGEYQGTSYDDSGIDVSQLRLGVGFIGPSTSGVFIEYNSADLDDANADGFAIHARLAGNASPTLQLYGDVGYAKLTDDSNEDFDGLEFTLGGAVALNTACSLFVDYRKTSLDSDSLELDFTDIRAGVRFNIGA